MKTKYIESNPNILGGKPVFVHTRLSVALMIRHFADGWTIDQLLVEFPALKREYIYEALQLSSHLLSDDEIIYA